MQTLKLKYPIDDGGTLITELKIRRPKVRDQLSASKLTGSEAEQEVAMFAGLSDLTPDLIAEMDFADYQALQKLYTTFLD